MTDAPLKVGEFYKVKQPFFFLHGEASSFSIDDVVLVLSCDFVSDDIGYNISVLFVADEKCKIQDFSMIDNRINRFLSIVSC